LDFFLDFLVILQKSGEALIRDPRIFREVLQKITKALFRGEFQKLGVN